MHTRFLSEWVSGEWFRLSYKMALFMRNLESDQDAVMSDWFKAMIHEEHVEKEGSA